MNYILSSTKPIKPAYHRLFEIDREYEIAYCIACGWTEIHRLESSTERNPRFYCTKRFQEISIIENKKRHLKAEKSPRHILSEIDPENMTATCSKCGPAKIIKRTYKQALYYTCEVQKRDSARKYQRTHYTQRSPYPNAHVLSQIDEDNKTAVCSKCGPVEIYVWQGKRKMGRRCSNAPVRRSPEAQTIRWEINTNIINSYKAQHGCKRCRYNESPQMLHLYSGHPEKKELKIEKVLTLTSKEVKQELESCDVFCVNCRSFVNYDQFLENLRSTIDY